MKSLILKISFSVFLASASVSIHAQLTNNPAEIEKLLKKSLQGDHQAAMILAANAHNLNTPAVEDYQRYQKYAEKGDYAFQYLLANEYFNHAEDELAMKWLTRSAEAGFAVAQADLGKIYIEGDVVEPDLKKATQYLNKAAAQQHAQAQYDLAQLYLGGQGVTKDLGIAKGLLELAGQQKHEEALTRLGEMYENGQGVTKNYKMAADYYLQAAKAVNPGEMAPSYKYLADLYETGGYGLKKDLRKAKEYREMVDE